MRPKINFLVILIVAKFLLCKARIQNEASHHSMSIPYRGYHKEHYTKSQLNQKEKETNRTLADNLDQIKMYSRKIKKVLKRLNKKYTDPESRIHDEHSSKFFDIIEEKSVEVLPMPMARLADLVFLNVSQAKLKCFVQVFDGLTKNINAFLNSTENCPITTVYQNNFIDLVKPANEIKKRISTVIESCNGPQMKSSNYSNCFHTMVSELYDINRSLIDMSQKMFFANTALADKCKLPSIRALLCTSLVFIGDIFYCKVKVHKYGKRNYKQ